MCEYFLTQQSVLQLVRAGAPGRQFAIGICADRGSIGDNMYHAVAAQGCNVFLAPSAGAGHIQDWITLNWGYFSPAQKMAATAVVDDPNYPSFRPRAYTSPPQNW